MSAELDVVQPQPVTNWSGRDDYALRSMAQTRAVSKALRLPLGFIVALAGYEATPADEMPAEEAVAKEAPAFEISESAREQT